MTQKKDLYSTLGVKKDASAKEIKDAFKKAAVKEHPDKEGGNTENMVALNHAYKILGNPNTRERYDSTGQEAETPFEQKFMGLINETFGAIVDQANVEGQDIVDVFKKTIAQIKQNVEKKLEVAEKRLEKAKVILKKITTKKNKTIITVTELNIENLNREVFVLKEDQHFLEKALIVMNDYSYEYNAPMRSDSLMPDGFFEQFLNEQKRRNG